MSKIILQIALDFVDLKRAVKLAKEAVRGGIDWIEAGTPLIKSCGLDAVRKLRENFPEHTIVADMKTVDTGRTEVEIAAKSGADVVSILGISPVSTVKEAVDAAKNYGCKIMVDMLEVKNIEEKIKEFEKIGIDYVNIHTTIDEQMEGKLSFEILRKTKKITKLPVAVAGGLNSENVHLAVKSGADIVIVGGAIIKSKDAFKEVKKIKRAIKEKIRIKTELYRRVKEERELREIFLKVSTANISDAMHRASPINGLIPVCPKKFVGKAVTVRTYPGDWAKPVRAIDISKEGDVIVIDAGGTGPACWGELATNSAKNKKICGVIIWGGIRDTKDIKKIGLPSWAKIITPQAGEPKGFGEINVPIRISGILIEPGDWIIGDNDGVIVVSKKNAVEVANRSMDVLEKENCK